MDQPLVSIVTPSLNRASLLEKVVRNIQEQTYARIEHIVVDGASSDGTVEFLRGVESEYLRWVSEPDTGMYNAVNKGFAMARGEILAYLNTDDLYFPYSVECAVEAFDRHPDLGFVYGDMVNFTASAGCGHLIFYPPIRRGYIRRGGLIGQPTVFWRRQVADLVGEFDESLALAADHEYWRRMSTSFSGRRLDEVLAYEGEHEGRLTSGEYAMGRGRAELEIVRQRHDPDAGRGFRRKILNLLDRAWIAFWYRCLTTRFLFWSLWRSGECYGHRWQGFLRVGGFQVLRRRMFIALIPYIGRRHKRCHIKSR